MREIFALTTRGLEAVAAREIAALAGVTVTETAYRRVAATCAGSPAPLLGLRTVDDVFLQVATAEGIGRPREALARLRALGAGLDLRPAAAACAGVRPVGDPPAFSVTASFVGRRNYSTAEIKAALAGGIAARHGWPYEPDDARADLNVRLFIEHERARVGVRLGRTPLHERAYKRSHLAGSLKPPVAAAMVALAEVAPGMRLLDPCCGAGTILIEAAPRGATILGGDRDAAALRAARENAAAAGVTAALARWDATALPLAAGAVDRVVTNLPWGRQVATGAAPARFYARSVAELRRVLAPGGRLVLLTDAPELLPPFAPRRVERLPISLFGQTPAICVISPAGS
jgi:23S rRNA G2445 N2-methylase RlmL